MQFPPQQPSFFFFPSGKESDERARVMKPAIASYGKAPKVGLVPEGVHSCHKHFGSKSLCFCYKESIEVLLPTRAKRSK